MESSTTKTLRSFLRFIYHERTNRRLLWIALSGTVLQFIIFKILYPFPDFFSDSYSYISAASAGLDVSIWPIGYSKFLAVFHGLTHSDTALVGFQYFFLEIAALYFYFSLLYFYKPAKITRVILFLFLFFDPLSLYLSNYVMSDALFAALSLWWLGELIWIINRPRLYQVFTQGVLLFLAFTVRNNAYIYPFIGAAAFLLSRQRLWVKLAGCLLGPALLLPFVLHTRSLVRQMTGTAQFSLFTGWQLASNALYAYPHIRVDSTIFQSADAREVNRLSREYFLNPPKNTNIDLLENPGNYFIQSAVSPLKKYLVTKFEFADEYGEIPAWGKASVTFEEFGTTLIKHYPGPVITHFVLPNARNFLIPFLGKLTMYNSGYKDIDQRAQNWFDYKTNLVSSWSPGFQGNLLVPFCYGSLFINVYFLIQLGWFFLKRRRKIVRPEWTRTIYLFVIFFVANFFFSILTSIILLRYQVVPLIATLSISLLLSEWLERRPSASEGHQKIATVNSRSVIANQ